MSKRAILKKQQYILLIIIVGALSIICGTTSYFIEHPTLTMHIEQQEASAIQQDKNITNASQTDLLTLTQKLQANPNDARILLELSKYFIELCEWKQAEYFLLHALIVEPNNPDILYLLGITQYNQEEYIDAVNSFKKVLIIEPDPSAQYSLGLLYLYYLDKKNQGLQYLQQVIDNPKSTPEMKQTTQQLLANHK